MEKPKLTKAERRAKQRSTNLLRAEKMHQVRLEFTPDLLEKPPALPFLNIGCSGWFYWDWKGKFYPDELKTNEWFKHYRAHFDTVELNAPFYGWPTVATVHTWRRQAEGGEGKDFIYTIKVSELITHIHQFKKVAELIKDFGLIADLLGPRFGCFLYQLPPSYEYTSARLKDIVSQVDPSRRNVVELRHASWWQDKVFDAFEKAGIIFCTCSGPKLPDEMVKTAEDVYVRFHGPEKWYRYNYSDEELADWGRRIQEVKPKRIWAYFNNDYDAYAIHNALTLHKLLAK